LRLAAMVFVPCYRFSPSAPALCATRVAEGSLVQADRICNVLGSRAGLAATRGIRRNQCFQWYGVARGLIDAVSRL